MDRVQMLGIFSQLRGIDSTGVAIASVKGKKHAPDYLLRKETTDSSGFFYNPNNRKILSDLVNPKVVIGHCRSATHGNITRDNAHPYRVKHIIGAHNGTIASLAPGKDDDPDKTTDSLKLYTRIASDGVQSAVDSVGTGAYALTWFNTHENTVNLLRNGSRPLWVANHKSAHTVYWASERWMLEVMGVRENIISHLEIEMVPIDTMYSFRVGSNECRVSKVSPKIDPPTYTYRSASRDTGCRNPWYDNDSWEDYIGAPSKKESTIQENLDLLKATMTQEKKPDFILLGPPVIGPGSKNVEPDKMTLSTEVVGPRHITRDIHDVFPGGVPKGKVAYPLLISDGTLTKCLRATLFDGSYMSVNNAELQSLLNEGCIISKRRANIHFDKIVWLNSTEYCMAEYRNDGFILEYTEGVVRDCNLVYVAPHLVNGHNQQIRKNEERKNVC